jgi:hypothetical protein
VAETGAEPARRLEQDQALVSGRSTRASRPGGHLDSDLHVTCQGGCHNAVLADGGSLERSAFTGSVDLSSELGGPVAPGVEVGRGHSERLTAEGDGRGGIDG